METDGEAGSLTFQLAKKLEYGLKLVRDRSGMKDFVVTKEAVTDMETFINDLVKKFYRQEYDLYCSEKKDDQLTME